MGLIVIPLELAEANQAVSRWHRHHQPAVGHRFSLGAMDESGQLRGAVIVGRTVARHPWTPRNTVEVLRLATDGARNACSFLLQAAARTARHMGFERIQTYTLESESGASLRAAGWREEVLTAGGQWSDRPGQRARRRDQPTCPKRRWACQLNPARPVLLASSNGPEAGPDLFGSPC